MGKRRIRVRDLTDRIGTKDGILTAIARGELPPHGKVEERTAIAVLSKIGGLVEGLSEPESNGGKDLGAGDNVHVMRLKDPNIYTDDSGERVRIEHIGLWHEGATVTDRNQPVYESLRAAVVAGLGNNICPIPDKKERKPGVKPEGEGSGEGTGNGEGGGAEPEPPPEKIGTKYRVDPAFVAYLAAHEGFLTSAAFSDTRKPGRRVTSYRELEKILGADILARFEEEGLVCDLQTPVDFAREVRSIIISEHRRRERALLNDPRVASKVSQYITALTTEQGDLAATINFLADGYIDDDSSSFFKKSANARTAYAWFAADENRIEEVSPKDMIGALRESVRGLTLNRPEKQRALIMNNLRSWVAMAMAADTVETNEKIAAVMPFFEEVTNPDSEEALVERKYEGMRQLTAHILERDARYVGQEVDFICFGLWYKGYFPRVRVVVEDENGGGEGLKRELHDTELGSAVTQFMSPAKHLLRRNTEYRVVLMSALDRLLEKGDISRGTTLTSKKEDLALGARLYDEIPMAVRKSTFRRLTSKKVTEKALTDLRDADGKINFNGQISYVLPYFVGINREEILGRIREHYEKG